MIAGKRKWRTSSRGIFRAPSRSMAGDTGSGGRTCLELTCSGQQLETAKLTFTGAGTLYRVTCGPLTDDEFARLAKASQTGEIVRLVFPRSVVTLSHITLECPKLGWAQIEGLALRSRPARQNGSRVSDRNAETQS
jgi:hypothetical protein